MRAHILSGASFSKVIFLKSYLIHVNSESESKIQLWSLTKLTRVSLRFNYLTFGNLNIAGVSLGVQNERRLVVVLDVWSSHGPGFYYHLG
jgi:hypothetical protein